jgi:hypothetical protein
MTHRRSVFVLLLICSAFVTVQAWAEHSTVPAAKFEIPSARRAALGGLHAACADDLDALFSNPAGFVSAEGRFSLTRSGAVLSGPVFTLAGLALNTAEGNLDALFASDDIARLLPSLYVEVAVPGPVHFGYVGNGLGFGIFNTTKTIVRTGGSALPTLRAALGEQVLLAGGYSFRIPLPDTWRSTLDAGLLLKAFITGDVVVTKSLLEMSAFMSGIGLDTLRSEPFDLSTGIGLDVGILYRLSDVFSFGLVGRNVYTPVVTSSYTELGMYLNGTEQPDRTYGTVPPDLSAGIMFTPRFSFLDRYLSGFAFMLDYKDALDFIVSPATSRNPILHVGIGCELTLLEVLDISVGLNEGLFSAGFGLDFSWFSIRTAMYGRELSPEPGMNPVFNLMMTLDFSL